MPIKPWPLHQAVFLCLGGWGPCWRRLSCDCWQSWEAAPAPSILCCKPVTAREGLLPKHSFLSFVFWVDLSLHSLGPLLPPACVGITPWGLQSAWRPGGQLLTKVPFRKGQSSSELRGSPDSFQVRWESWGPESRAGTWSRLNSELEAERGWDPASCLPMIIFSLLPTAPHQSAPPHLGLASNHWHQTLSGDKLHLSSRQDASVLLWAGRQKTRAICLRQTRRLETRVTVWGQVPVDALFVYPLTQGP